MIELMQLIGSSVGGGSTVAVVLYFLIRSNTQAIETTKGEVKQLCTRVDTIEEAWDTEAKDLKDCQDKVIRNTNAIIQHLIMTDKKEHPEAVAALQQVLTQDKVNT